MTMFTDPRIARLITLIRAALRPPAGAGRIALALALGTLCHVLFAAGVLAMVMAMFFGLSESLGTGPWPLAALANAALIAQFPLAHSAFLTGPGGRLLARLIPGPHGQTRKEKRWPQEGQRTMRRTSQRAAMCACRGFERTN